MTWSLCPEDDHSGSLLVPGSLIEQSGSEVEVGWHSGHVPNMRATTIGCPLFLALSQALALRLSGIALQLSRPARGSEIEVVGKVKILPSSFVETMLQSRSRNNHGNAHIPLPNSLIETGSKATMGR